MELESWGSEPKNKVGSSQNETRVFGLLNNITE